MVRRVQPAVVPAQFDLAVEQSVLVTDVELGSLAAAARIKPGDIVVALDGTAIDHDNPLTELLSTCAPSDGPVGVALDRRSVRA